jgi:hypothetical protein
MQFIERKVLEVLLAEAAKRDFYPAKIMAWEAENRDEAITQTRMQWLVISEYLDAWDSTVRLWFDHVDGSSTFWVDLIVGNGEDVIHDYSVSAWTDGIMNAVTEEIEA